MNSFDIPSPRSDFVVDGRITREWNMFLRNVFARIGGSSGDSSDILKALIDALTLQNDYRQIEQAFPDIPVTATNVLDPIDLAPYVAELSKKIEDIRQEISILTDPSALLAETRKAYALDSLVTHLAGTETITGAKTFSNKVTAPKFQTASASVSATTAVATTIIAIPNATPAMYLVSANTGIVNDVANYSSFAVVAANGTAARIVFSNNATLLAISLSGLNVQVNQTSGGTQTVTVTLTEIG